MMLQDSFKRAKSVKFSPVPEVFTITPQSSPSCGEKRPKSKGKASTSRLTPGSLQPDLDIVSGFAFLSFASCEELEAHIELNEVNTQSLSVDVVQKRKILTEPAGENEMCPPKKAKPPAKKKIIGNAAILKAKRSSSSPKFSSKPDKKELPTSSASTFTITASSLSSLDNIEHGILSSLQTTLMDSVISQDSIGGNKQPVNTGEGSVDEISLECSEKMESLAFDEDIVKSPTPGEDSVGVSEFGLAVSTSMDVEKGEGMEKKRKKKKKKRDRSLSDQTCQTMFRIKKKKKFRSAENNEVVQSSSFAHGSHISSGQGTNLETGGNKPEVVLLQQDEFGNASHKSTSDGSVSTMTDKNGNELPVSKPQLARTCSKRVEKIDYCARSGGIGLLNRHHIKRTAELEQEKQAGNLEAGKQSKDCISNKGNSQDEVNFSSTVAPLSKLAAAVLSRKSFPTEVTQSPVMQSSVTLLQPDSMSDTSGNESSSTSDQNMIDFIEEGYSQVVYRKKNGDAEKYFFGSVNEKYDKNDESLNDEELDIETADDKVSKTFVVVSTVRGLNESYMLGQVSMFPEKTTPGTVDVSIQSYDNDIQLYMKHASEQEGKIIKIISADEDEDGGGSVPNVLGLPKFLRPPEHVKAVRSATERSRRLAIGDLFSDLKKELFTDLDLYFSKQAILSKAITAVEELEKGVKSSKELKKGLKKKNADLRKQLNVLLFGRDLPEGKIVDIEKLVPLFKKNMGVNIIVPPKVDRKEIKVEGESIKESYSVEKNITYVHSTMEMRHTCTSDSTTRKGRPPQLGKFTKLLQKGHQPTPSGQGPAAPAPFTKKVDVSILPEVKVAEAGKVVAKQQLIKVAVAGNVSTNAAVKNTSALSKSNENDLDKLHPISVKAPDIDNLRKITERSLGNSKILCNLSRFHVHQSSKESVKVMESKDVVHIKIENDTMQRIDSDKKTEIENKSHLVSLHPIPLSGPQKPKTITPVTCTKTSNAVVSPATSTVTKVAVGTQAQPQSQPPTTTTVTTSSSHPTISMPTTQRVVFQSNQPGMAARNVQLVVPKQSVVSSKSNTVVNIPPNSQLIGVPGKPATFRLVQRIPKVTGGTPVTCTSAGNQLPSQKTFMLAQGKPPSLTGKSQNPTSTMAQPLRALLSGGNVVTLQPNKPVTTLSGQVQAQHQQVVLNTRLVPGQGVQQGNIQQIHAITPMPTKVPIMPITPQQPKGYRAIAPSPVPGQVQRPMRFQLVRVPVTGTGTPGTQTILIPVKPNTSTGSTGNTIIRPALKPGDSATTARFTGPGSNIVMKSQSQTPGSHGFTNLLMSVSNTGKVSFVPARTGQVTGKVPSTAPAAHATVTTSTSVAGSCSTVISTAPSKPSSKILTGKPFMELEKILANIPSPGQQPAGIMPGNVPRLENTQTTVANTTSRAAFIPATNIQEAPAESTLGSSPVSCLNSGNEGIGIGNLGAQTSAVPVNAESTVQENVVTADKLSCNIESSIPDIANELPDNSGKKEHTSAQGNLCAKPDSIEPHNSTQSTEQKPVTASNDSSAVGDQLNSTDETTANDFDLLAASLDWPETPTLAASNDAANP